MAEQLGGLTKGAAATLGQVVGQVLGRLPDVGRRTRRVFTGGGGFANYAIRFQITSYSPSIRTAECIVLSIPYGMIRADIPNIDEILSTDEQTVIHVADPNGCCFNEPSADLLGRAGWAQYMQPLIPDACSDSSYLEPQWEALTLCCGFNGCEDIA